MKQWFYLVKVISRLLASYSKNRPRELCLEMGHYETKEEALTRLKALEENQEITVKWHIAKRKIGQSPK